MTEKGDMSDKRWVRFWRSWRGTSRRSVKYVRLAWIGSDDEAELRGAAESWATSEGPHSESFQYGWEIMDKPPDRWLREEIVELEKRQVSIVEELEELQGLLSCE